MKGVQLSDIEIRRFKSDDDIEKLTQLLNTCYKKLLDQGFRYLASHQDSSVTRSRIEKGNCFLAFHQSELIGTICYYAPHQAGGHEWYDKPFIASYGQFAVKPEFQRFGIGKKLIDFVENEARKDKAEEVAIDTAEGAAELIRYYSAKGYRLVAYAQWNETNYRSVILSKALI